MIKAILFDYGGVISKGGGRNATTSNLSEKMAHFLGITPEKAKTIVGPENWDPFMKGRISEDEFWRGVEKNFGKPIPFEHRDVWNNWEEMQPEPEMAELIKELKARYKIGLLSTTVPSTAKAIRDHGGYDDFDFVDLSHETGSAKPEKAAYELAMTKLPGIKPEEVVFIDDQERCLVPARELGMKTILAIDSIQIKKDLEKLLS